MNGSRTWKLLAITCGIFALAAFAPSTTLASSGGWLGEVSDKTITFCFFGVIALFPLIALIGTLVQNKLEARKDRRRSDLERYS